MAGEPGQEVWIDLVSDDFDSYLYVVGPGLAEPITDDGGGGACHARINLTFLDRGVFFVVASSVSTRETGTYQLRVSEDSGPAAQASCGGVGEAELADGSASTDGSAPVALPAGVSPGARQLTLGQTVVGRLTDSDTPAGGDRPVHTWALQGRAGESATIRLESDDFDAYLMVVGPGLPEELTDDDGGGGLNSELTLRFPETGWYVIAAAGLTEGSTGSYSLSAMPANGTNGATIAERTLQRGMPREGVLTAQDALFAGIRRMQAWVYEARAGETIRFDLISPDFDTYLYLTGPGIEVMQDDDGGRAGVDCRDTSVRTSPECTAARIEVTFPEAGSYVVGVSSLSGGLGAFTLSAN